jgi:hypothetical protein
MNTVPLVGDMVSYGRHLAAQGPAWSVFDSDGKFLGAGGLGFYWRGVAEGWLILSRATDRFPVSLHKIVRTMIDRAFATHNLKRLQVSVPISATRSVRWIERLGFQREGEMRCYGPDGSDFRLYSIVRE